MKTKIRHYKNFWIDENDNIIIEDEEIKEMLIPDWYKHYFMR